jgi:3-phenylpropionate/cinnamic acid dioxygenase small subunit
MPLTPEEVATRLEVEDLVIKMFVATDERDWSTLEACFTNPFVLDMTSMVGGSPLNMTPQQVASAWADGFKPLSHVHHQVGNLRTKVTGGTALVRCYGIALHHRSAVANDSKSRRFVGSYEIDLKTTPDGWRITRLHFNLKFIDGNLQLESAT